MTEEQVAIYLKQRSEAKTALIVDQTGKILKVFYKTDNGIVVGNPDDANINGDVIREFKMRGKHK